MLHFNLNSKNTGEVFYWEQDRWKQGDSFVAPFNHPAIEAFYILDEERNQSAFIVREIDQTNRFHLKNFDFRQPLSVSRDSYQSIIKATEVWPLNCIALEFCAAPRQFTISRNENCSLEFYVKSYHGQMAGHWDPLQLIRQGPASANNEYIGAFIGGFWENCSDTFYKEIIRLPQNAYFLSDGRQNKLTARTNPIPLSYGTLKEDADVVAAFDKILSDTIARTPDCLRDGIGLELSGGIDSSDVAIAARKVFNGSLQSFAILFPGAAGQQQRRRRKEIITQLKLIDHCVEGSDHLILSRLDRVRWPTDALYAETLDAEISVAANNNCLCMLTGIGGDELTILSEEEQIGRAQHKTPAVQASSFTIMKQGSTVYDNLIKIWPESVIPTSAILAMNCRASAFLRKGIWPIHPLCTPEIVRFCRSLPLKWREGRRISRDYLISAGLSHDFCYPVLKENFMHLFTASGHNIRSQAKRFIINSYCIDSGIVDGDALRLVIEEDKKIQNPDIIGELLRFVRVELLLNNKS